MTDPSPPAPMPTDAARQVFRLYSENKFDDALRLAEMLIPAAQDDAFLFNIAGASAMRSGRASQAETYFQSALRLQPDFDQALFGLAVFLGMQKRFAEAETTYKKILALKPNAAEVWCNLGSLYAETSRFDEAEHSYRKAIALRSDFALAWCELGVHYMRLEKADDARACFEKAITLNPAYALAYNNYGRLCADLQQFAEAEKLYQKALSLTPASADTYYNYGILLAQTRRYDKAEAAFRKTIELNPGYIDAYAALGNLFKDMDRLAEAENWYNKVLQLRPEDADAYAALGALYIKLKRFAGAENCFRKALSIDPDSAKAAMNYSVLLLLQARFEEGWPYYEARYRYDAQRNRNGLYTPGLSFPQWRGESLAGKSLLIWHEQGYGDIIQSARYVGILKRQGAARITLVCKRALVALMKTLDGIDAILCFEDAPVPPPHDYWTFPLSIPLYCKTRLETIPSQTGYLFAPADYRAKWRGRIPSKLMKVGIVWKGYAGHVDDAERSLAGLEKLRSLWAVRGVDFISLQKGEGEDQAAHPPPDQPLIDLGPQIRDFADTAAIIEQLDLVICVDTAVAHLAGALGKPVWVLTRQIPDWRWMLDREDSPWYPTLRLFRQTQRGDWGRVVESVRLALQAETERYWTRAVQHRLNDPIAQFYLGCIHQAANRGDEAEACYRKVIELDPGNPIAYGQLGNLLKDLDRLQEAEECYRRTLAIMPNSFVAHNNVGTLLKTQGRYEDAEFHYREALRLSPAFPDAYNNLGNLYLFLERFDEAETHFLKALELSPAYIDGYHNLGLLYRETRRYDKAEACYRHALRLEPGNPKTMFVFSLVLLAQARFDEGWRMFETPYRYDQNIDKPVPIAPFLPFTPWRGQPLAGKSLLLWYEQGFGDVIQFARYAAILKRRGASRITLMCKAPQKTLFETLEGIDRVLSLDEKDTLGTHDYWAFVMSCPLYCGTRLETIPAQTGYISTPPAYRTKWRDCLKTKKIKVGLVWKGSTDHKRDFERSLAGLEALAPLWGVPGITFVSLQKGRGEDQASAAPGVQPLIDLGSKIEDFADAAAIVEQLDLVICVDTAIAHLAGALGKPVWLLVQYTADWRWMIDREDSPWYPSMRLFRQSKRGDWAEVIRRVGTELAVFASPAKS